MDRRMIALVGAATKLAAALRIPLMPDGSNALKRPVAPTSKPAAIAATTAAAVQAAMIAVRQIRTVSRSSLTKSASLLSSDAANASKVCVRRSTSFSVAARIAAESRKRVAQPERTYAVLPSE